MLDYSGDAAALGKNVGDDLREGKPTLPLIRVMEVGTPEQQQLIRDAIKTGDADFAAVAAAIQATIADTILAKECTRDVGGKLGTREAGAAFVARLQAG